MLVESTNVRFTFDYTYDGFQSQTLDTGFTFRQDGAVRTIIDTEQHLLIEDGSVTIRHSGSASGQEEYTLIKRGLTTDTDTGTVVAGELASALAAAGVIASARSPSASWSGSWSTSASNSTTVIGPISPTTSQPRNWCR